MCEQVASHRSRFRPRKYKWRSVNEQAAALSHNNTERFSFFAEAKTKKTMLRATGHRVARHLLQQRRHRGQDARRSRPLVRRAKREATVAPRAVKISDGQEFWDTPNIKMAVGVVAIIVVAKLTMLVLFSSLTLSFFSLSLIANTRTQLWHPFAKYSLAKRSE